MYDLADGYDAWLDRLDALNAETDDNPAPAPRGKPYTRPADHAARLEATVRQIACKPRYTHRSHRHQRGEE